MKGVAWGVLYNKFKNEEHDTDELEERVAELMIDDDVTRKSGIYSYVLDDDESHLSICGFTDAMKREAYERQKGKCPMCPRKDQKKLDISEMHADHIKPWSKGGKTIADNCQMLCAPCNRTKSGK